MILISRCEKKIIANNVKFMVRVKYQTADLICFKTFYFSSLTKAQNML